MALWELDEFKPPTFLGFVRNVPAPQAYIGTRWLPNLAINDLDFEYILGANKKPVMAHVMGFDSEAPIHGRPGLGERVRGELPPIKRKAKIGEKEIIKFLTPRSGTTDVDDAINSVYTLTADLLDAVQARLEWLRMRALSEDFIDYDEGGVEFRFDFGYTDAYQINLVDGTDGAGDSLTNAERTAGGAAGIKDPDFDVLPWLQYMVNKSRVAGFPFTEWVASSEVSQYLLANNTLRERIRGTNAPSAILTQGEIDTLFSLYGLPTVTPYDVWVTREEDNGSYTDVRTMEANKSFFTTGGTLGNTLLGPTAESRVLYGTPLAAAAPGVWAETYGTTEPPAEWTKVAAIGFPSIPEANRVGQMTLWAD